MRNRILRMLLLILSYAPFSSVALAAHAKSGELDGEAQNEKLIENTLKLRAKFFAPNQMVATVEDATAWYAERTGLQGFELEVQMQRDIAALQELKLIQFNEKYIVSAGPSEH
ncbi:MAG: hypothetical protein EOP06_10000 [Proteobacteria bacterium]|nr:MAG: hypothetical protein EOP06_10000 [Pseudomonadota bacterium]